MDCGWLCGPYALSRGKGQCFIRCRPWLHVSTTAELIMKKKFSCLLIHQHSPWMAEHSLAVLLWLLQYAMNVFLYAVFKAACRSIESLCKVLLHHSRPWLSARFLFSLGEGSCSTVADHTTGSHHPIWRCLFWVSGGPESFKWSVLWGACWEEGGYSWRQWLRVGHLLDIGCYSH